MSGEIDDLTGKARKQRQQLMAVADAAHQLNKTALSETERQVLEHFWQQRWQRVRDGLTLAEIVFLEREAMSPGGARNILAAGLTMPLASLVKKGYLTLTPGGRDPMYALGALGERYMAREHPDAVATMQKRLDWLVKQPLYLLIGLLASLLTVVGALSAVVAWVIKG